jgi:hypothetical protein
MATTELAWLRLQRGSKEGSLRGDLRQACLAEESPQTRHLTDGKGFLLHLPPPDFQRALYCVQVFLGFHQGTAQAMSSFIPNVPSCDSQDIDQMGMPALPLPMLAIPRLDDQSLIKSEWLPCCNDNCVVPTNTCQNGATMNREARVLRC